MARIRSVHPELCTDETMVDVSAQAERTFVRLWPHLDDAGRAADNVKLLKAALYPLHDSVTAADVDRDLDELAANDLLIRYEVAGKRYLTAKPCAWANYQRPRHPTPSKLPAPPERDGSPEEPDEPPTAERRNPTAKRRQAPAVVVGGEGDVGGGGEPPVPPESSKALALVPNRASPPATDQATAIFEAWVEATNRTGRTVLTPERRRLIQKQLKHYPPEDLVDAVRGWRHSSHHRGENDRSTTYNDLELLLRDAKHIEMFRDLNRDPPSRPVPKGMQGITAWLARTGS